MAYTGHNLYRGIGGIGSVDFATVIDTAASDATSVSVVGAGHVASTRYTYVLRPVIADLETPDYSCSVALDIDADGDWLGNRPGKVEWLEAQVIGAGKIELRWAFRTPYGGAAPNDFGIYYGNSPDLVAGSPDATESYTRDGQYSKEITLTGGSTYYFAITSRTSGGVESILSAVIGPLVADDTGPAAPDVYVDRAW